MSFWRCLPQLLQPFAPPHVMLQAPPSRRQSLPQGFEAPAHIQYDGVQSWPTDIATYHSLRLHGESLVLWTAVPHASNAAPGGVSANAAEAGKLATPRSAVSASATTIASAASDAEATYAPRRAAVPVPAARSQPHISIPAA